MRNALLTSALFIALAIPAAAHADTFNFTANGSGGGFSGSGTFIATNDGGGMYTITGISGTDITGFVTPGSFNSNDDLLFPASPSVVDSHGFAFAANQGNTNFTVDIFSSGAGVYDAYLLDSDGSVGTIPVTLSLVNTTTPEPSSAILLGTGLLGMAGVVRKRLAV